MRRLSRRQGSKKQVGRGREQLLRATDTWDGRSVGYSSSRRLLSSICQALWDTPRTRDQVQKYLFSLAPGPRKEQPCDIGRIFPHIFTEDENLKPREQKLKPLVLPQIGQSSDTCPDEPPKGCALCPHFCCFPEGGSEIGRTSTRPLWVNFPFLVCKMDCLRIKV